MSTTMQPFDETNGVIIGGDEDRELGEYIVKAVNCHDELVSALKACESDLSAAIATGRYDGVDEAGEWAVVVVDNDGKEQEQ